jgi:D-alanyl-lipoteichoic acid acyltransferase DltB (MBOAT superfamily)
MLAFFKYYNFINENLMNIARFLGLHYPAHTLRIILPIGLSFHTFQAMSYTIEVYRKRQKAERSPLVYALYVMFYPQLVAGPIERPQHLLYQFREKHYFEYRGFADGLKLMMWGLFKKAVIADRVAMLVNHVYYQPAGHNGLQLVIATVFFAFQIYCDFSGYSDIAIGAAQVMGFNLMNNFNRPYFSKSIAEFWKRWHISLSTWFRDYLYIPMGGSRVNRSRWHFNLFVTFLISGLWHGASWTYVLWGALNGAYIIFGSWTRSLRDRLAVSTGLSRVPVLHKCMRLLVTFSLVCLAWVLFRSRNMADARYIFTHLFAGWPAATDMTAVADGLFGIGLSSFEFTVAVGSICFMEIVHMIQRHRSVRHMLSEKPAWLRWTVYYALLFAIVFLGVYKDTQFIYFQF